MNTGQIVKAKLKTNYTQIPNQTAQQEDISFRARGVLVYLLSLPEDWVIYKTELHKNSKKEGRDATIKAFQELIDEGYIAEIPMVNERGLKRGYNYIVYPDNTYLKSCIPENPHCIPENPITENQVSENPSLQKKYNTKETKDKKEKNSKKKVPYIDLGDGIECEQPKDWNMEKFSDADRDSYKKFLLRIYERYPTVWELKKPTLLLFTEMVCKFGKKQMDDVLQSMENWPKLKSKNTIGLTMNQWLTKRMKEQEEQQKIEQAKRMG